MVEFQQIILHITMLILALLIIYGLFQPEEPDVKEITFPARSLPKDSYFICMAYPRHKGWSCLPRKGKFFITTRWEQTDISKVNTVFIWGENLNNISMVLELSSFTAMGNKHYIECNFEQDKKNKSKWQNINNWKFKRFIDSKQKIETTKHKMETIIALNSGSKILKCFLSVRKKTNVFDPLTIFSVEVAEKRLSLLMG